MVTHDSKSDLPLLELRLFLSISDLTRFSMKIGTVHPYKLKTNSVALGPSTCMSTRPKLHWIYYYLAETLGKRKSRWGWNGWMECMRNCIELDFSHHEMMYDDY